jgi:hypothetical protein
LATRSRSAAQKLPKASAPSGAGVRPSFRICSAKPLSSNASNTARSRPEIVAAGVPFGANRPRQPCSTRSTPPSRKVGTPGSSGSGASFATAIGRNCADWSCSGVGGTAIRFTCPATTATTPGPVPW